jgi:hypothetical protein
MKVLHYARLAIAYLSWATYRQSNEIVLNSLKDLGVFQKPEVILPVVVATALYLIGFAIAELDRKVFRASNSIVDRELDTVISLIAFAVMLFSLVDSLSTDTDAMRYEKAKLVIIFILMFTFTWFKSYAESLGVTEAL